MSNDTYTLAMLLCALLALVYLILTHRTKAADAATSTSTAKRKLAVWQPTCADCEKWSKEAAAEIIERFPAFKGAAECLTVAEMAYPSVVDDDGNRTVHAPKEALAYRWSDFGACTEHAQIRHKSDVCDGFEARGDG